MPYRDWINALNALLEASIGIDAESLADQPYSLADRWRAGEAPADVADEITADPLEWM